MGRGLIQILTELREVEERFAWCGVNLVFHPFIAFLVYNHHNWRYTEHRFSTKSRKYKLDQIFSFIYIFKIKLKLNLLCLWTLPEKAGITLECYSKQNFDTVPKKSIRENLTLLRALNLTLHCITLPLCGLSEWPYLFSNVFHDISDRIEW